jgi:flagellar protein FlbD
MIEVTRINGTKLLVNADQVETVEETPDTIITLVNGKKIVVTESRQEVRNLVVLYKRDCIGDLVDRIMDVICQAKPSR